jgi:hypothetical protein
MRKHEMNGFRNRLVSRPFVIESSTRQLGAIPWFRHADFAGKKSEPKGLSLPGLHLDGVGF